MKYRIGQIMKLAKPIECAACTIPVGANIRITAVDPFLKTYDIVEIGKPAHWICDVSENELFMANGLSHSAAKTKKDTTIDTDSNAPHAKTLNASLMKTPDTAAEIILLEPWTRLVLSDNFNIHAFHNSLLLRGYLHPDKANKELFSNFDTADEYENAIMMLSVAMNVAFLEHSDLHGVVLEDFVQTVSRITMGKFTANVEEVETWFRGVNDSSANLAWLVPNNSKCMNTELFSKRIIECVRLIDNWLKADERLGHIKKHEWHRLR